MISIKELRKNKETYQKSLARRGEIYDLEHVLQLDSQIRELKTNTSLMRAQRNAASESIGKAKKSGENVSEIILKTSFIIIIVNFITINLILEI